MKRVVIPLLLVLAGLGLWAWLIPESAEPPRTATSPRTSAADGTAGNGSGNADPGSPEAVYAEALEALERGRAEQAAQRLERAAEQGHASAMFRLGALHEEGRGVEHAPERAVAWYRRAAEAGDERAWLNLAHMYAKGDGVPEDESQAAHWYERAARAGNAHAQYALGLTYNRGGTGLERDRVAAWFWLTVAADGFGANTFRDSANQARAEIARHLSEAELERARARLRRWHEDRD